MTVVPHHSLEELQLLAKQQKEVRFHIRFQAVMLAKGGQPASAIARILNVTERSVQSWVRRYNEHQAAGLIDSKRTGRKPWLSAAQLEQLKVRIEAGATVADGVCVLRGLDLQRIVKDEFGFEYSLNGIYRLLHQLGYSSLSPRPQHRKADPAAQEEFKKN